MQSIRRKKDIEFWMAHFNDFAERDENGNKLYFVIDDQEREGILTFMKYPDNSWTVHGVGQTYCDPDEIPLSDEEVMLYAWKNRKSINQCLKQKLLV